VSESVKLEKEEVVVYITANDDKEEPYADPSTLSHHVVLNDSETRLYNTLYLLDEDPDKTIYLSKRFPKFVKVCSSIVTSERIYRKIYDIELRNASSYQFLQVDNGIQSIIGGI
jgi:hypothetical protein